MVQAVIDMMNIFQSNLTAKIYWIHVLNIRKQQRKITYTIINVFFFSNFKKKLNQFLELQLRRMGFIHFSISSKFCFFVGFYF